MGKKSKYQKAKSKTSSGPVSMGNSATSEAIENPPSTENEENLSGETVETTTEESEKQSGIKINDTGKMIFCFFTINNKKD